MKWVSSFQAVKQLRDAGVDDVMTLAIWAEKGSLDSRAAKAECDGEDDPLRKIPRGFWKFLRKRGEAHWEAGDFSASVIEEPDDDSHHWRFSGVTFDPGDLRKMIVALKAVPKNEHEKMPRVAVALLQRWWKEYPNKTAIVSVIRQDAEAAFPNNHVPRSLIRDLYDKRIAGRRNKQP